MTREDAKAIVKDLQELRSVYTKEYNRLHVEIGKLDAEIRELYSAHKLHVPDEIYNNK